MDPDLFPSETTASKAPTVAEYRLAVVRESPALVDRCDEPAAAAAYWGATIAPHIDPFKEHLVAVLLNTKLRVKGHVIVSMGALNECLAHPREIFRPAIIAAAWGFVLMHNHPSGDPAPSDADRRLTTRIAEGARLLQINFSDHVIVGTPAPGQKGHFSFREAGML